MMRQVIPVYANPVRVDLRVFCITASQYCRTRVRIPKNQITMRDLPTTFHHGFDGQILIHVRKDQGLLQPGVLTSDHVELFYCAVEMFLVHRGIDRRALARYPNRFDNGRCSITWVIEFCQPYQVDQLLAALQRFPGGSMAFEHWNQVSH